MCWQAHGEVKVNIRISASILPPVYFFDTSSPANSVLSSTEVRDAGQYAWLSFLSVGDPNPDPQACTVSKPSSRAPNNDFLKNRNNGPGLVDYTWNHSTWESWGQEGHEFKVSPSCTLSTSLAYRATQWVISSEKEMSFFHTALPNAISKDKVIFISSDNYGVSFYIVILKVINYSNP